MSLCFFLTTLGACRRKPAADGQAELASNSPAAAPTEVTFGVFARPVGHVLRTAWTSRLSMRFHAASGDTENVVEDRCERRDKVVASADGVPTHVDVLYERRTQTETENGITRPPTANLLGGLGFDVYDTAGRIEIVRRQKEPDDAYLDATVRTDYAHLEGPSAVYRALGGKTLRVGEDAPALAAGLAGIEGTTTGAAAGAKLTHQRVRFAELIDGDAYFQVDFEIAAGPEVSRGKQSIVVRVRDAFVKLNEISSEMATSYTPTTGGPPQKLTTTMQRTTVYAEPKSFR